MTEAPRRISGLEAIEECRATSQALISRVIERVRYAGLLQVRAKEDWDFQGWHWPEVGVELTLVGGQKVHAIWSERATHFHLEFRFGGLEAEWIPLRDDPDNAPIWDVTDHPAWRPLAGAPIVAASLAMSVPDDPPVEAPVAVKLYTKSASVWLVAGAPRDAGCARVALEAEDLWLGHDEVMVVFDDEIAARIGLLETITVGSVPERVRD